MRTSFSLYLRSAWPSARVKFQVVFSRNARQIVERFPQIKWHVASHTATNTLRHGTACALIVSDKIHDTHGTMPRISLSVFVVVERGRSAPLFKRLSTVHTATHARTHPRAHARARARVYEISVPDSTCVYWWILITTGSELVRRLMRTCGRTSSRARARLCGTK